jgi:hypothetical protein
MTQSRLRPVVADIRDRHDVDRVVEAKRRFEPGTIALVTFKDEGEDDGRTFGPVTLFRDEPKGEGATLVPYGTPDPEGVFYIGWLPKSAAIKIARMLAAHFEEV